MNVRPALAALALALLAPPLPAQQPQPAIREWDVPWPDTRPRDPFVDHAGKVWFVGQTGDYVGVLDPADGQFRRYELGAGVGPHSLVVGPSGMVWFTGNRVGYIGRLDPRDGSITRYPMPDPRARDPHTPIFDSRGDLWFTVQGGNFIGKLTVATGQVRLVSVPTRGARPYGIVLDRTDRPWVALFGTNKLATVDPVTFALTEYPLPRAAARPRRLAQTSDGMLWYGDYAGGMLGRFDPRTHAVREWPLPGGAGARPYAMMVDGHDRVWAVETGDQPNRFVGFDPASERFLPPVPVPSNGGTVRHMMLDRSTQFVWFGTDMGTIGRLDASDGGPAIP